MSSSKISVEILQRVANVGKPGDIIEVSHAYGMNYLIPKGIAKIVTPERLKQIEIEKKRKAASRIETIEQKRATAEKLHMKALSFEVEGHGSKVFGGVDEHAIIDRIRRDFAVELEKKHLVLPEGKHLKKVGTHDIKIDLGHEVYIRLSVELKLKAK